MVLVGGGLMLNIKPVQAADVTLIVDTLADDPSKTACTGAANDCSLRGAISHVNATVIFPRPSYQILLGANTYTLSTHGAGEDDNQTGDLDVNYSGSVMITGDNYLATIINGDLSDRVIDLYGGDLWLENLSIRNGFLSNPADYGGGISAFPGTNLTLSSVSVDHNTAGFRGGGINTGGGDLGLFLVIIDANHAQEGAGVNTYNTNLTGLGVFFTGNIDSGDAGGGLLTSGPGNTTLTAVLFSGNEADRGGGVFNGGGHTMTINDGIIRGNTAGSGSGITSWADLTLNRTEISNNGGGGSPMDINAGNITLSYVTVAENLAVGASALSISDGVGALDHVTITDNTSSGGYAGLIVYSGSIRLMNSIINNTDGNAACEIGPAPAALTSFDYNIASDNSCNLILAHDHPGTDAVLRTLGNYGGFSYTAPPSIGSIAIDQANPSFSPTLMDQRGFSMVDGDQNGSVIPDIGASEFLPPVVYLPLSFKP